MTICLSFLSKKILMGIFLGEGESLLLIKILATLTQKIFSQKLKVLEKVISNVHEIYIYIFVRYACTSLHMAGIKFEFYFCSTTIFIIFEFLSLVVVLLFILESLYFAGTFLQFILKLSSYHFQHFHIFCVHI